MVLISWMEIQAFELQWLCHNIYKINKYITKSHIIKYDWAWRSKHSRCKQSAETHIYTPRKKGSSRPSPSSRLSVLDLGILASPSLPPKHLCTTSQWKPATGLCFVWLVGGRDIHGSVLASTMARSAGVEWFLKSCPRWKPRKIDHQNWLCK